MSKSGLDSLTKSLALELAEFGIRVNSVSPSLTQTEFIKKTGFLDKYKIKDSVKIYNRKF